MTIANDYCHVVEMMVGADAQKLYLIPDTRLAESMAILDGCDVCKKTYN